MNMNLRKYDFMVLIVVFIGVTYDIYIYICTYVCDHAYKNMYLYIQIIKHSNLLDHKKFA